MAVLDHDAVPLHHGVEIVTRHFADTARATAAPCTRFGAAPLRSHARELAPDEAVVEAHVVRDEHAAREPLAQLPARCRSNGGASASISLSMPVSAVMPAGTCTPGFTQALPFEVDRRRR